MKTIHCPHCRGLMQDDGSLSGTVQCPHCRGTFTLGRAGSGTCPAPAPPRPPAPPSSLAIGGAAPAIRTGAVGRVSRTSVWQVFWALVDWRFERYLTPAIIRTTWLSAVATAALGVVLLAVALLRPESGWFRAAPRRPFDAPVIEEGLPMQMILRAVGFAVGTLWLLIWLLWIRVICEFLIVIFQIAESLKSIDRKTKGP